MTLSPQRKRLLYQATHRGTREADILVGGFVEVHIGRLTEAELGELEEVLVLPDDVLVGFLVEGKSLPNGREYALLERMREER